MTPSTEHMEQASQGMMQAYEDMNVLARDYMDAVMRSASAMSKGLDETIRSTSGIVQESMTRAMSASKTLTGAKNMREMMDLHAEFMKDCFDCWMAGTGKISEISARSAKEVIEPMAQHANDTISKIAQKTRAA